MDATERQNGLKYELWFVDETLRRIRKQGRALQEVGYSNANQCKYRTKDGRSCAAGMWIKDEKYSENMEGSNVSTVLTRFGRDVLMSEAQRVSEFTLCDLQTVHDHQDYWRAKSGRNGLSPHGREYVEGLKSRIIAHWSWPI